MSIVRDGNAGSHVNLVSVRWLASGEVACSIPVVPLKTLVKEVKTQIEDRAGVPVSQQHLFVGSDELDDCAIPNPACGEFALVRGVTNPSVTNLKYFHPTTEFDEYPRDLFHSVQRIRMGVNGDIKKCRCSSKFKEECVVIKEIKNSILDVSRKKEADEKIVHRSFSLQAGMEDSLTEIGVWKYLDEQAQPCEYILKMLGIFADVRLTYLVTEYADGGDLFEVVSGGTISETQVEAYMFQATTAVAYLHRHHIAHRDISLENLLLKDGIVKLMDFGQSVQSHSLSGTPLRFFLPPGKDLYRSFESYVPTAAKTPVVALPNAAAGEISFVTTGSGSLIEVKWPHDVSVGKISMVDVCGYAAQPIDIYALGMCFFILSYGFPPWQAALLRDANFRFVWNNEKGLESLLRRWRKPLLAPEKMKFINTTILSAPRERPTAEMLLASPLKDAMGKSSAFV